MQADVDVDANLNFGVCVCAWQGDNCISNEGGNLLGDAVKINCTLNVLIWQSGAEASRTEI